MQDNRLEIIVEIPNSAISTPDNPKGITRYNLDTFPSEEQDPIELNFCINDINDISNRNASSSKTMILPETPNNREVFGFISDLNLQVNTFSPNKRAKCYVMLDTVVVLEGWLQLKNIKPNYRTGLTKLECVVYSNQLDFFKAVGESYLQDLTGFKNQTFNHSLSNMTASWFQDQTTTDIYYPLIDYGFSYDKDYNEISTGFTGSQNVGSPNSYVNVNVNHQMFPAVYLKSIVDTIFSSASGSNYYYNGTTQSTTYQYDSYFFNSPFFKSLIIPYTNGILTQKGYDMLLAGYTASNYPDGFYLNDNNYPNPSYNFLTFNVLNKLGPFNQINFNNGSIYKYTGPSTFVNMTFSMDTKWANGSDLQNVYIYVVQTFGSATTYPCYSDTELNVPPTSNQQVLVQEFLETSSIIGGTWSFTTSISFQALQGSYFSFYLTGFKTDGGFSLFNTNATIQISSSQLQNINVQLNDKITLPGILPANVKQKDFLTTLFNMFNLYIDYDPNNPNILRIEPRDDYYYFNGPIVSNSPFYMKMNNYGEIYQGNIVIKDWSEKIDINEQVNIDILGNTQNKTINITYKEDKDYYNENYNGYINRIYGNKLIEVDNDFNTGQQNIEVLFGPTVLANIFYTYNFPIPNLTKQIDTTSYVPSGRSNANMKLMQRHWYYPSSTSSNVITNEPLNFLFSNDKLVLNVVSATNSILSKSYTYSYYPYAGNFNNPYFPSADLNFDQAFYYYYNLGGTQSGLSFSYESGLNNTIYNTFYKNQFEEILDVNSKILTAQLYLTTQDIRDFRFSDVIYLRLGSSGQYYHVNKINNYSLTEQYKTTEVELIKIKEIASYPLPVGDGLQTNNKFVMTTSTPIGTPFSATISLTADQYVLTKLSVNVYVRTFNTITFAYVYNPVTIIFYPGMITKTFTYTFPIPSEEVFNTYGITSISPNKDRVYNYTF